VPTTPVDGEATKGGAAVLDPEVCAKTGDAKKANAAATRITRIRDPPMNDGNKSLSDQKVPVLAQFFGGLADNTPDQECPLPQ
jgi:hypothetical protein